MLGEVLDGQPGEAHGQRGLAKSQSLPLKAARAFTTEQTKCRSSPELQKALHLDYLCWRTAYEIQRCN